jgi:putative nucleotidyltransferase with HDIG domain
VNRYLRIYIAGLVALSVFALGATSLLVPVDDGIRLGIFGDGELDVLAGLGFWTAMSVVTSALPVRMPRGSLISTCTAPILAAMVLGGPTAAGWVALIGTTEFREISGRVRWYGTLSNHAGLVLPAIVGGAVALATRGTIAAFGFSGPGPELASSLVGAGVYLTLNLIATAVAIGLNTGQSPRLVFAADSPTAATSLLALAPLSWLMAQVYRSAGLGWWTTLLFAPPIYVMRAALQRVVEMREMFTQTIGALAGAVDARDQYTANHSQRVKEIAVDIGRVMRLPDADLEALEWGGLLHDIGKIGVPDSVLLKQDRLSKDERIQMNRHPTIGANIVAKVERLAPELPIIRHHHEWYNGSGYPDRLVGDEIPRLARVLHVADAFEAMIAQRPYRMRPLTTQQAIDELRKYSGIQFDPVVVDAFMRTRWAEGIADAPPAGEPRPVALLAQAAAHAAIPGEGAAADPT